MTENIEIIEARKSATYDLRERAQKLLTTQVNPFNTQPLRRDISAVVMELFGLVDALADRVDALTEIVHGG